MQTYRQALQLNTMKRTLSLSKKRCQYCKKSFESSGQVSRHVAHSDPCRQQWEQELEKLPARRPPQKELNERCYEDDEDILEVQGVQVDIDHNDYVSDLEIEVYVEGPVERSVGTPEVDKDTGNLEDNTYNHQRWTEVFPGQVAEASGRAKTMFDEWRTRQMLTGVSEWFPFENEDEWALAQWLFKNVGQTAIEEYLKLPSVSF